MIASLKTLIILQVVPKAASELLFRLSFAGHWLIFSSVHVVAGFRNNFQNHRRLWNNFLESQATAWKPEQASWRGFLEGFSELVSDFVEATETLFEIFYTKNQPKIVKNHKPEYKKHWFNF
jgi:hypothetical protein